MTEIDFRRVADDVAPAVVAYVRRRRDFIPHQYVDDIVVDVLEIMWRKRDQIPAGEEIPWSIGITKNVLRNSRRHHARRHALNERQSLPDPEPTPEDRVVADDTVRRALAQLKDSDRDVLLLSYWEELPVPQIATILGISTNAAAVRVTRARQRFEAAYQEISAS